MKEIKAKDQVENFQKKVLRALSKGPMKDIINIFEKEEKLIIEFSKMGKSKIIYKLEKSKNEFRAVKEKEDISFTHFALKGEVEKELKRIMLKFGAEIIN